VSGECLVKTYLFSIQWVKKSRNFTEVRVEILHNTITQIKVKIILKIKVIQGNVTSYYTTLYI